MARCAHTQHDDVARLSNSLGRAGLLRSAGDGNVQLAAVFVAQYRHRIAEILQPAHHCAPHETQSDKSNFCLAHGRPFLKFSD